eukprot:14726556-Alexandrium_andersonii.AAC.1
MDAASPTFAMITVSSAYSMSGKEKMGVSARGIRSVSSPCTLFIIWLRERMNRSGERVQPCLTPLS